MPWKKVMFDVTRQQAECLSEAMQETGAVAVTFEDCEDQPLYEPGPGETPLWEQVRVVGLYEQATDTQQLLAAIGRQTIPVALSDPTVEAVEDRDWVAEGQKGFAPTCFGGRLWICPGWETCPEPAAPTVILDPGLAFGTGTHPTTALCLEWLANAGPLQGLQMADYGCGSGILAIAALKLGAKRVWAIDNDPQALQATLNNASRNAVDGDLEVILAGEHHAADFDVVIANILSGTLITLAQTIGGAVKAGGWLVLSGILEEQVDEVADAYKQWIDWDKPLRQDGWILLKGQRRC